MAFLLHGFYCTDRFWLTADVGLRVELGEVYAWSGLPAGLTVFGHDVGEDAATHIELGRQAHEFRLGGCDQVIQDTVSHRFVETAFVTERPHIQFQALELDTLLIRDVIQVKYGKIWLPGLGTQAGKFRDLHMDMEIASRIRIVEGFERFTRLTRHKGYRINRNKSDAA